MSAPRKNPAFPPIPFALLLVEGGDERTVCGALVGSFEARGIHCWTAEGGSDLPRLAELASRDPNIGLARSVGVVIDAEDSAEIALKVAQTALRHFGLKTPIAHGTMSTGSPPVGAFILPDGYTPGCIETLIRRAAPDQTKADCVDQLFSCVGTPQTTTARRDKAWMIAYLALQPRPLRFYEAFGNSGPIDVQHSCLDDLRTFLQRL